MTATVSSGQISLSIERPALYVVATPIGNLADISYRAVKLLAQMDLLLVEDKRVTQRLLQYYSITKRLVALHEHNEADVSGDIVSSIVSDRIAVALISDAGTPLISDPGFRFVRAAHAEGIPVLSVPGPCAAIAALSIAGLPSDRFVFEGFLPARKAARLRSLNLLNVERRTLIFFEAPHRISATLEDMRSVFGNEREVAVAREITKLHETLYRGPLRLVSEVIRRDGCATRGEIVIILSGARGEYMITSDDEDKAVHMITVLCRQMPKADAIKLVSEWTGLRRNRLYSLAHGASLKK
tara:strand:- start:157 stop:1050 length:894 start_codon:yes stop_codon:yes gene_type:complete